MPPPISNTQRLPHCRKVRRSGGLATKGRHRHSILPLCLSPSKSDAMFHVEHFSISPTEKGDVKTLNQNFEDKKIVGCGSPETSGGPGTKALPTLLTLPSHLA